MGQRVLGVGRSSVEDWGSCPQWQREGLPLVSSSLPSHGLRSKPIYSTQPPPARTPQPPLPQKISVNFNTELDMDKVANKAKNDRKARKEQEAKAAELRAFQEAGHSATHPPPTLRNSSPPHCISPIHLFDLNRKKYECGSDVLMGAARRPLWMHTLPDSSAPLFLCGTSHTHTAVPCQARPQPAQGHDQGPHLPDRCRAVWKQAGRVGPVASPPPATTTTDAAHPAPGCLWHRHRRLQCIALPGHTARPLPRFTYRATSVSPL